MGVFLVIIGIIIVVVNLCKDANGDAEVREHARRNGLDFYASSTGLRRVDDNTKYYK